jgi:hypothetical protein
MIRQTFSFLSLKLGSGAEAALQSESTYLACLRPWVPSPAPPKPKQQKNLALLPFNSQNAGFFRTQYLGHTNPPLSYTSALKMFFFKVSK